MLELLVLVLASACLLGTAGSEDATGGTKDSRIIYPNDFLLHRNHGPQTHNPSHDNYGPFSPGFQHNPEFHRNQGDFPRNFQHSPDYHKRLGQHPPDVWESPDYRTDVRKNNDPEPPAESVPVGEKSAFPNSTLSIPVDFIRNISQYSVNDLLLNFVEGDEVAVDEVAGNDTPFFRTRFDDDDGARSKLSGAAVMPKKADCIPEFRKLELASTDDPSILYIPQCTRVEQCGGCCSHALLSCQPIEKEILAYQVLKTQYTGNKKLKILGKEIIPVEKHTKCKCDCKIKEEDCNEYQEYRPAECRCACKNIDEEKKCSKNGARKLWNPELCACLCRNIIPCTTGYTFDHIECKCSPQPLRRRSPSYETRDSAPEPVSIVPLGGDDY